MDWYRGLSKTQVEGQDTFWTSDLSVAGDYGTTKVGEPANIIKLPEDQSPQNIYKTTNKETLAAELRIKTSPYDAENGAFDDEVKGILLPRGFDAVFYTEGTLGFEELHLFGKIKPKKGGTMDKKKEFYERTRMEVSLALDAPPSVTEDILRSHEQAVKNALNEGKTIPPEVLKDYPQFSSFRRIDEPTESGMSLLPEVSPSRSSR